MPDQTCSVTHNNERNAVAKMCENVTMDLKQKNTYYTSS